MTAPAPPFRRSGPMRARHGFFGRFGGVSEGPYESLNCGPGSKDAGEAVAENRERVRRALGAEALVTAFQTHSARAVFCEAPWEGDPPEADALVTDRPGLLIGVLAADCTPVLFHDEEAGLIGAAHAGWRGSLGGILEATVALLAEQGADPGRLRCAIGPHLRAEHFEVEGDLIEEVTGKYPEAERFFLPAQARGKHLYDHTAFCRWRLEEAGVPDTRIDDVGGDSRSRRDGYFSYRRSRKDEAADYGRNFSGVVLG